jgi:integrase
MANLMHAYINNVYTRAVRWGFVPSNPCRDIQKFKTKDRTRLITPTEFHAIRAQAEPRLAVLMDLAVTMGQRIGDLLTIKYTDIEKDRIYFTQAKTGARLYVAISPEIRKALKEARKICHHRLSEYLIHHHNDGRKVSYGAIYHHWHAAREAAGVDPDTNFHDLRAVAATAVDDQGGSAKSLLGHANESTTKRYLRSKRVPVAAPAVFKKVAE